MRSTTNKFASEVEKMDKTQENMKEIKVIRLQSFQRKTA